MSVFRNAVAVISSQEKSARLRFDLVHQLLEAAEPDRVLGNGFPEKAVMLKGRTTVDSQDGAEIGEDQFYQRVRVKQSQFRRARAADIAGQRHMIRRRAVRKE